jgi:hypothetical protein
LEHRTRVTVKSKTGEPRGGSEHPQGWTHRSNVRFRD